MSDSKYVDATRTPEQKLAHIVEEAGELISAIGKAQRWGLQSTNPELRPGDPSYGETNQQWIEREIADLERAIDRWTFRDVAF